MHFQFWQGWRQAKTWRKLELLRKCYGHAPRVVCGQVNPRDGRGVGLVAGGGAGSLIGAELSERRGGQPIAEGIDIEANLRSGEGIDTGAVEERLGAVEGDAALRVEQ
jgi:hypothetical protein